VRVQDDTFSSHLRVERLSLADSLALAANGKAPFAALGYGTPHSVAWMPTVNARVLSSHGAMADVWQVTGAHIESGTTGIARWRTDGHWLLGAIDLDEAAEKQGLAELAHRAYRDLFKTLEQAGTPHLQRIWNYLPQINADGGGLERYRQFNLGRQEAFFEAGRAAFEGAPAACALGIHQGMLSIRFLAGQAGAGAGREPAAGLGLPLSRNLRTALADLLARRALGHRRRQHRALHFRHREHRRARDAASRRRAGANARNAAQPAGRGRRRQRARSPRPSRSPNSIAWCTCATRRTPRRCAA
jgi:hypothetical protein